MLHRFRHAERGVEGHDPATVRRVLGWLRRERFELVPLDELVRRLEGEGPPLERAVAFTIDDGYADHAEVAAPLFAEFDCPVTTFVVSGFLDGALWLWWDRIAHAIRHAARPGAEVPLGDDVVRVAWRSDEERDAACLAFVERCKRVPEAEKQAAIGRLAEALEVSLPAAPPPGSAPMSWDDLRRAEAGGMRFAPHTVTHPVLARTGDTQAEHEIRESWARVRAEARHPVDVFCYPNGQFADFGPREVAIQRACGLTAAVVGELGYAERAREPDGRYAIRRFPFPDDVGVAAQYAGGFERLKARLRGGA
jgi:peptidoglycan/xylan/chitin deacetylase (PgdA/CDA1 family)